MNNTSVDNLKANANENELKKEEISAYNLCTINGCSQPADSEPAVIGFYH